MLTSRCLSLAGFALSLVLWPGLAAALRAETAEKEINFTAKSANVKEPGNPVKIQLIRWSTDEERSPVVAALDPSAPPPAAARGGQNAAGGRGRAGRGGRGGARGGRGDTGPPNPVAVLTAAIGRAPTLGYIWTNEVTGYSIKYAYHAALPDGSERIILATDRRLGAYSQAWKPLGAEASAKEASGAEAPAKPVFADYEFTLVELRLDASGMGEGKTSLTTKVTIDTDAKTIALDNYAATIATLQVQSSKGKGQSKR